MALTNLRASLERTFQNWLGERITLNQEIAKIKKAYEELAEKEERLHKVEKLLECSEFILQEIKPGWNRGNIKPRVKNAIQLPFQVGDVTRWTFEILREADEPLRSRTIAEKIVETNGLSLDNKELMKRVMTSVDSALRSKVDVHVEKVDTWPIRWKIIEHPTKLPYGR